MFRELLKKYLKFSASILYNYLYLNLCCLKTFSLQVGFLSF